MAGSALGFTLGHATDAKLNTYTQDRRIYVGSWSSRTDRTSTFLADSVEVELALGRPSTLRATVKASGWTPAIGNEIRLHDDGANGSVLIFGGHITRVDVAPEKTTGVQLYAIEATDYSWELGQSGLLIETWETQGVNTLLRSALAWAQAAGSAPSSYAIGYVPAAIGDVTRYTAFFQTVPEVIAAVSPKAYWSVDAYRHIHVFTTPDHLSAASVSLTNTSANVSAVRYAVDATDIINSCAATTAGTSLAQACGATDTTVYVDDASAFIVEHYVIIGTSAYVLSAVDLSVTPHALTLTLPDPLKFAGGTPRDWAVGTPVVQYRWTNDLTAIAALAAAGMQSGSALQFLGTSASTPEDAYTQITGAITKLGYGVKTLTGTMVDGRHTGATSVVPGAQITATVSTPVTISGTYLVQRVTLRSLNTKTGWLWSRSFEAATVERGHDVVNILADASVLFPDAYL